MVKSVERQARRRGNRSIGRTGGKVAAGSVAATVVAAVVHDLSRDDSLILKLVDFSRKKLADLRRSPARKEVNVQDAEYEVVESGDKASETNQA
ncbi:hypothetical protein GF377_08150 [candidate division GN15 bacterium]|nr:hypothetical protein [candidate division GN15 bacterium]